MWFTKVYYNDNRSQKNYLRTIFLNLAVMKGQGYHENHYFQEKTSHSHHHEHGHNHEHHHHLDHLHEDGFTSLSFETEQPLNIRKLQYFLDNQLPESVFRAKGIL